MISYRDVYFLFFTGILLSCTEDIWAQVPPQRPSQTPATKSNSPQTPVPAAAVAGPQQTKHYPILVVAHGNEPSWSLRQGAYAGTAASCGSSDVPSRK